jgi:hypothetical protein
VPVIAAMVTAEASSAWPPPIASRRASSASRPANPATGGGSCAGTGTPDAGGAAGRRLATGADASSDASWRRMAVSRSRSAGPGASPKLLGQGGSQPLVDGQRVGLPPAAVQRGHQLGVDLLVERMVGRRLLQFGYQLPVFPGGQPRVGQRVPDLLAEQLQPPRLLFQPGQPGQVGQRPPAPQASASRRSAAARAGSADCAPWRSSRSASSTSVPSSPRSSR